MKWIGFLIVALGCAVASFFAVVHVAPRALMHVAMTRVGAGVEGWRHAPRVSETSRAVVRPSPDLAYSSCVYDVSDGAVLITMAPSADYWSLSFYQANTDNFFVVNDRAAPQGVRVALVRAGAAHPVGDFQVVEAPSARGIALQRRLAPNAAAFAAADAARRSDVCAALAQN